MGNLGSDSFGVSGRIDGRPKNWIIPKKTKIEEKTRKKMRKRPETKIAGKKTKEKLHPENSVLTRRYLGARVPHAKYYLLDFRGHERAFRFGSLAVVCLAGGVFGGLGIWRGSGV